MAKSSQIWSGLLRNYQILLRGGAGAICVKIKSIEKIIVRPGLGSGIVLIRLKVYGRKYSSLFLAAFSDSRENA